MIMVWREMDEGQRAGKAESGVPCRRHPMDCFCYLCMWNFVFVDACGPRLSDDAGCAGCSHAAHSDVINCANISNAL